MRCAINALIRPPERPFIEHFEGIYGAVCSDFQRSWANCSAAPAAQGGPSDEMAAHPSAPVVAYAWRALRAADDAAPRVLRPPREGRPSAVRKPARRVESQTRSLGLGEGLGIRLPRMERGGAGSSARRSRRSPRRPPPARRAARSRDRRDAGSRPRAKARNPPSSRSGAGSRLWPTPPASVASKAPASWPTRTTKQRCAPASRTCTASSATTASSP